MKFALLSKVIEELSSFVPGARVERVFQGDGKAIFLVLHKAGKDFYLLMAPDRSLPRLYLAARKPAAAESKHPFTQYLKSRVTACRVLSIGLLNLDRIAEMRFIREGTEYRLVFELTGSASNLILTDEAGVILAAYYTVPADRARPVIPGIRYELPPKRTSPSVSRNQSAAVNETRTPAVETPDSSANREAELYYEHFIGQRNFENSKKRLLALINKLVARADRKREALSKDQKAAGAADEYRRAGDMILANLGSLQTGMKQAELPDFDRQTVLISLDPKRSPTENAGQYFKKYKKAKAGRDIIEVRLRETEEEKSFLLHLLSSLQTAVGEPDLHPIRSALIEKGYLRSDRKKKEKSVTNPGARSCRTVFYQGWEIVIGKNEAGNDYITTKMARVDDLWLHAEGLPGSHVLVRNPEKSEIPSEVFKKAASLAAYYSKGRTSGKTSVTYALARYVKKPKGAKPGLVTLSQRKTIVIQPQKE